MKLLSLIVKALPQHTIYAHCDIPCGIYDPHAAQVAAHTVLRMTNLLMDLKQEDSTTREHQVARLTKVKEDHAEMVKHEVRVLWGDYFKEEHLKDHPALHELVFKIMKLASKARQEISQEAAAELLTAVQELAEIFYKTKNRETTRVATVYPHGGEIVVLK